MMKRIMSIFLVVALCFTMLPMPTAAAEHCHHHEVHTDTCGYVAAVPGSDCTHSHDGSCGYIEAVSEVPCACAADESGALVHTEGCGYVAPIAGADCTHAHDGSCGFTQAVSGSECTYFAGGCPDCAAEAAAASETTGATEAAEEVTDPTGETTEPSTEATEPSTEATEPSTEPAPVCTCGTDDPAIHATNCPVYVAPENPVCYCVEKCTAENLNVWCDVCGIQGADACQGEDTATTFKVICTVYYDANGGTGTMEPTEINYPNASSVSLKIAENGFTPPEGATFAGWTADGTTGTVYKVGDTYKLTDGVDVTFYAVWEYEKYDLWIGGEQVTSVNANQEGNSWNYDSDTNTLYITDDVTISTGDGSALVSEGGGLNIHIASGKTLSLTGNQNTVVLNGDSTISGGGSMTVTGGYGSTRSVYVTGSLDISNITLSATATATGGTAGFALCSIGQMTFENVTATIKGQVWAGISTYYPVSISGSSVISIYASGDASGALITSTLTLSDTSHLKVWTDSGTYLICDDHHIPIPVSGGYYRTGSGGDFIAGGSDPVTLNGNNRYFEYIGAGHVGEVKQNSDGTTHGKSCTCSLAAVVESEACSGGTATCTEKAVCTVCEGEYGEVNPNNHTGTSYTDGFRNCCGEFEPATGNGTEDALYQISNAGQLLWFAQQVNSGNTAVSGKLMNSIDLSGITYTPIGTTAYPYTGTLDGQGYSIKNMVINSTAEYQGLFGVVGVGTVIKNIVIDASCSVSGGNYTAALVGGSVRYASGEVTIENCVNYANVSGGQHTGGIFGCNTGDDATIIIRNCANLGNITGGVNCGTIAGYLGTNTVGTLENCWNTGTLTATSGDSFAHLDAANITNCWNLNTLTASTKDGVSTFTAEELASGALAYKLGTPWGQTIGSNSTPVLGGAKVYYGYTSCGTDAVMVYSNNSSASEEKPAHTGGTATCTEQAVCTVCGESYGELGGDHIDENKDHSCDRNCGYVSEHTGGTATCTEQAECTVCGESYGELGHVMDSSTGKCANGCEMLMAQASATVSAATTYYETLDAAIQAVSSATAESSAVVKLMQDIAQGDNAQVVRSGVFTLDLNGKTLSGNNYGLAIVGADVTVTSGTVTGGAITGGTDSGDYGVRINTGALTIAGGTVTGNKGIYVVNAAVTVTGGTVSGSDAGMHTENSTLTITGGTVSGGTMAVIARNGSTVTITGGTISGQSYGVNGYSSTVTISGGSITGGLVDILYPASLTLGENGTGATFPGGITATDTTLSAILADGAAYWQDGNQITITDGQTEITGGDVTIKAACDHSGNTNTDYTVTDDTHSLTCSVCGSTQTENHTYTDGKCVCGAVEMVSVVSVNITWGAMSFTYTDGAWNPETHSYGEGGWTADDSSNCITVVNNGTAAVNVAYTYTQTRTEITGSFTDGTNAITAPVALPVDATKTTYLILNGKPSENLSNATLGTVTVKITQGGE